MKNLLISMAIFCLLAVGANAQTKATDFSGDWILDQSKSLLMNLPMKYMSMKVIQSDAEIRTALLGSADAPDLTKPLTTPEMMMSFKLDGTETLAATPDGGSTKTAAKIDKAKLVLTTERKAKTPRGMSESKTKDTWELSKDGNTLKIRRDMSVVGMGMTPPSEMWVFKRHSVAAPAN